MRFPLRVKFMFWLMAHTAAIYVVTGLGLFVLNNQQAAAHPDEVELDREELLIIYGAMLGALPIAVGGAWFVTGRVLRPLQSMLEVADRIGAGRIDQRLETQVATDELGHLARTLNLAFDNYHRLLERVDRFSLDAAHQLRNPLAAMRTSAEVCLQQARSPEEYVETMGRLLDELRRLGHTVEQLLLLARLSRSVPAEVFEEFDLARLVVDLGSVLRPAFEERQLALEVRVPESGVQLRGSPRLLEQAVANLLDNALRLTPPGGRVRVELTPPVRGRVRLAVADSGPGLGGAPSAAAPAADPDPEPDADADGDAEPKTATAPAAAREGTGLGLMIVGNIVQAHGGSVQASVSEWNGACFTLELPAPDPTA